MDKKQGFVKPIYQRAKEIEETKKIKIDTLKKTVDDKKAKLEEEVQKSKIFNTNKQYDEKEFNKWRQNTIEWENKKKQKIVTEKEKINRQKDEEISKYHIPNLENNKYYHSKVDTGVHDKLYNLKDEKHHKLMEKMIESIPTFKPTINKKVPKYIQQKKKENSISGSQISTSSYNTNTPTVNSKSNSIDFNEVVGNYNSVSKTERKNIDFGLSKKALNFNTYNDFDHIEEEEEEPEPVVYQEEIIHQYKEALEISSKINMKETLKNVDKHY